MKYKEESIIQDDIEYPADNDIGSSVSAKTPPKARIIEPGNVDISNNRQLFQASIFVHARQGILNKEILEKENLVITTIKIEAALKKHILVFLDKYHNINIKTIYNDIFGFIQNENNYTNASTYFYSANAKMSLEQYKDAIEDFDQAIDHNRSFADAYYNRKLARKILEDQKK